MTSKSILSIVTSTTILGGAELNLAHILNAAYGRGYKVTLIIWNIDNSPLNHWSEYSGFDIHIINSKGFWGLIKLVRSLYMISKSREIELSYISNITLASIVGLLRRISLFKTDLLVVRDPSSPFLRYTNFMKIQLYKLRYYIGYPKVDYLIFQTSLIQNAFYQNIKIEISSRVLPNPINLNLVRSQAEEFELNFERLFIVACGRLIYEKGFDLLIKAFYETTLFLKYDLVILGTGPLESQLKKLVNDLGIGEYVLFKGFVDNPMPYFKEASICVISSRSEGFPNILYQMLALNSKVIMTKCCGDISNIPGIELIDNDSLLALKDAMLYLDTKSTKTNQNVNNYLKSRSVENYIETFFNIISNAK